MTSISHYPHSLNTKFYAVLLYRNGNPISFVCRRYKCSKASLMRWNKKFDGTKESLMDKSHKPLSPHPNAHTEEELTWIKNYIRRNPNISLCELYGKLRTEKGYSRHACSLFRIVRKMKYPVNTEHHSKYTPKKYDTPNNIGIKWQMDVKVVPKPCYVGQLPDKFYQYTVIDEASRERFIHTKNNLLILQSILLNVLLFILVINLKLYKLIMVKNLLILKKLIKLILLILY